LSQCCVAPDAKLGGVFFEPLSRVPLGGRLALGPKCLPLKAEGQQFGVVGAKSFGVFNLPITVPMRFSQSNSSRVLGWSSPTHSWQLPGVLPLS